MSREDDIASKLISTEDHALLLPMIQRIADEPRRSPALPERLLSAVREARTMPRHLLKTDVVTLGSFVVYEDDVTTSRASGILTARCDDWSEGKQIPVLTAFGLQLLGSREGDRVVWQTTLGGWRGVTILRVAKCVFATTR
ncbi:GreA/GreB family elongation factor [Roseiarcaceae bacterium H3SJ34-1]|uniref:GreA/GreB family elongation factor n=1 Tax=Terripilifer ovatus TaxID=3032367 RepID=UPI003AB9A24F|nr:GreA/GreB family elongation factor [Roseiarcaceae bacterium H3SJ34-1]